MDLSALVKKYLEASGGFERAAHLSALGLSKAETEKVISGLDEDYQISRYMLLSRADDTTLSAFPGDARTYSINGFEVSHISFQADIQKLA